MTKGQQHHKQSHSKPKERGCWLTGFIILIAIHSLAFFSLLYLYRAERDTASLAWILPTLAVVAIATIVSMVGVWLWKRWGLKLFAIATVVSIAVGLIVTASQLWVFYDIMPLVILGYLVKDHWGDFD